MRFAIDDDAPIDSGRNRCQLLTVKPWFSRRVDLHGDRIPALHDGFQSILLRMQLQPCDGKQLQDGKRRFTKAIDEFIAQFFDFLQ